MPKRQPPKFTPTVREGQKRALEAALRLGPVEQRMRAAVSGSGRASGLYAALNYQLGWADATGRAENSRSAKGLRPRLCLLACHAVGGAAQRAEPAAAAVELTHEFSLIHDDVEDRDEVRRGRPSLWTSVGVAQAINAGDALFAIARRELLDADVASVVAVEMGRRYDAAVLRLAEGQYLDLAMEAADDAAIEAYEGMAEGKTGALLGLASALGALAGGNPDAADAFDSYGRALGVGFQIADDILGLWGDPEHTGKPAGADMARGKKGYPTVLALADAELAPLVHRAASGEPSAVAAALLALENAGVRVRARAAARAWADQAVDHLEQLELDEVPRSALVELAGTAVARIR